MRDNNGFMGPFSIKGFATVVATPFGAWWRYVGGTQGLRQSWAEAYGLFVDALRRAQRGVLFLLLGTAAIATQVEKHFELHPAFVLLVSLVACATSIILFLACGGRKLFPREGNDPYPQ